MKRVELADALLIAEIHILVGGDHELLAGLQIKTRALARPDATATAPQPRHDAFGVQAGARAPAGRGSPATSIVVRSIVQSAAVPGAFAVQHATMPGAPDGAAKRSSWPPRSSIAVLLDRALALDLGVDRGEDRRRPSTTCARTTTASAARGLRPQVLAVPPPPSL